MTGKKRTMSGLLCAVLLWALFLSSCRSAPNAGTRTLTVFAAASLTGAFEEIARAFEASHAGVTVKLNFGGSQALRTQIEQGAAADVFASASYKEMDDLIAKNFIEADAAQAFLTNQLVIILPPANPAQIRELKDLAKPGLRLILADEEVPAGAYARRSLDRMDAAFGGGFKNAVLKNIVSNEDNVKQVVVKVQLGEADAGIVYASDAVAASDLQTIAIPGDFNITAEYPIAALAESPMRELASEFIAHVLGASGQKVLETWGFIPIR